MLLLCSPFSFIFFLVYLLILVSLFSVQDFFLFWVLIEIGTLLFIGVSYSVPLNQVSPLIIFLLVQSVSSFYILLAYFLQNLSFFSLALCLNIGMFPFIGWFIFSAVALSPLSCFLAITLNNIPILILITNFSFHLTDTFFWVLMLINIGGASFAIFNSINLRLFLVWSSVANNSWLLISQASNFYVLLVFLMFYSLVLITIFLNNSSISPTSLYSNISNEGLTFFCLSLLSGLPPSPLFFLNFLVLIYLPISPSLIVTFLLTSSLAVSAYLSFFSALLTSSVSHPLKF